MKIPRTFRLLANPQQYDGEILEASEHLGQLVPLQLSVGRIRTRQFLDLLIQLDAPLATYSQSVSVTWSGIEPNARMTKEQALKEIWNYQKHLHALGVALYEHDLLVAQILMSLDK